MNKKQSKTADSDVPADGNDTMNVPRPEYPRPQFVRPDWLCLNGEWQFEIDAGDSGLERGLLHRELQDRITVPFCPESPLSGIGCTDFMNAVWYRRTVAIPETWVGRHRGGFAPFTCDLGETALPGETVTIVVRARDDHRPPQPRGKQSQRYANFSCLYTRTTGIWQTVWMEPVPDVALRHPRLTPDVANGLIRLEQPISNNRPGLQLQVTLRDADSLVCTATCAADADLSPRLDLPIPEGRRRLWSPDDPYLYDLEIELIDADGTTVDRATSYAGLRSVTIDGVGSGKPNAIKINGQIVFQRLVLDQGYYPDGIMTAPSDEALRRDIELSLAAGFNGARLHQKVFEERFLYHADRLGYLVWGEFADWGSGGYGPQDDHQRPGATYVTQWLEVLARDYSHPCIVGWCPLNETWQPISDRITVLDDVTRGMFLATKAMDPIRPVLDTSGYAHRVPEADVYDCHDYEQNVPEFAAHHAGLADGKPFYNYAPHDRPMSIPYREQPFFVSEFGGIWWNPDAKPDEDSWGYGERPQSLEEFYGRFEGLCHVLEIRS